MFIKKLLLATCASISVAGCNASSGLPDPLYFRAGERITPEAIQYQTTEARARCQQVARETTPSQGRGAAAGAVNGALGGALGGGANVGAQSVIIGAPLTVTTVGAAVVGTALYGGINGAIQGAARAKEQRRYGRQSCLAQEAGGIVQIPPSEGREILRTGGSRSYGRGTSSETNPAATTTPQPN